MHDCAKCQVPLHGHEPYCPVCGLKQHVKAEFQGNAGQYDKPFNPLGLILLIVLIGGVLFYAVQGSWIGQLIKRGPEAPPSGDSALGPPAAREKLENAVLQNLAGLSKTCKFVYTAGEKTVDRNYAQPVELTIDVNLRDTSKRRSIVEPVKSLMVPGHINTLTLNDNRAHATVTYSVSGSTDNTDDADSENDSAKSEPTTNQ